MIKSLIRRDCQCKTGVLQINLVGGLGNQLFQLACIAELSSKHGIPFKLITKSLDRDFGLDFLHFEPNKAYKVILEAGELKFIRTQACETSKLKHYREKSFHFTPIKFKGNHIKLQGYFQSEKYFTSIAPPLRVLLRRTLSIEDVTLKDHAAIQIRMGDMARNKHSRKFHGIISDAYIESASKILEIPLHDLNVFTDDISSIQSELPLFYQANKRKIESTTALNDMKILACHGKLIISNSSFGWWAAWLSSAKVVAPRKWFSKTKRNLDTKDLFLVKWIIV